MSGEALAAAATAWLNLGVAGSAVIALGWFALRQYGALQRSQKERIADQRAHTESLRILHEKRLEDHKVLVERLISMSEKQSVLAEKTTPVLLEIRKELSELRGRLEEEAP